VIQRVACIGDVHGCIEEYLELLSKLEWLSLDEIWSLADLVDRGPDSGAVVKTTRSRIKSIGGNHDYTMVGHYERWLKTGEVPKNADKARTLSQLSKEDYEYLRDLPRLHVIDDLDLVLVHGGLWPSTELWRQPYNVIRAQMIHPGQGDNSRWWGNKAHFHKSGKTEAENVAEGWARWYHIYNLPHRVAFGHSVFAMPKEHQNEGAGLTVGVDTGCCFGGSLTAAIFDNSPRPTYLSVRAKKEWSVREPGWNWET
jgi:diadenosine tetraphosphatase ApaH/serine/threonine PP2A family protein phosphatase